MRALTAQDILDVWEAGSSGFPVERALQVLACAFPERSREELANLTIGDRNTLLLAVRERTFGRPMHSRTDCPACRECLEFDIPELRLGAPEPNPSFRLPTSADLLAVADEETGEAPRALAERCATTPLDGEAVAALAKRMAEADPRMEMCLELRCPACGTAFEEVFDPGHFFWVELEWKARTLVREVHTLAAAYGWSEAAILGMSARRRRLYLEMIAE